MPAPSEPSSGYVLRAGGAAMLLDCGPGVAGALPAVLSLGDLDAVFITHLHLDHCYDLLPLAKMMLAPHVPYPGTAGPASRPAPVPLYVPPGGRAALHTLQGLFPVVTAPMLDRAVELAFATSEYDAVTTAEVGGCRVTALPVPHAVPARGLRAESSSGVFAYTGDTGWSDGLVELAQDADLLLCEATRREPDTGPHGHLSAVQAGELAQRAGARTLVLTHVATCDPAWLQALHADASHAFGGTVHLALPGAQFEFARPGHLSVSREVFRP